MTTTDIHPLDQAVALAAQAPGQYRGHTSTRYANMVGPFGGVLASTLLNAVLQHPERLGDPVALTVNFAGPVADGEFTLGARPLRTNRSTQHWFVELTQGGQVASSATVVTATRRETWGATELSFPAVPAPEVLTRMPMIGRTAWTAAYDMRFAQGGLDMETGEESQESVSALWIRDDPPRPLDYVSLAAICDAFFPRIFVRRPKWVPVGTVSLTTYFHADAAALAAQAERPVLAKARGLHFGGGYFDQTAEVWSDGGAVLATSHQVVYYKE